jgi:hypothetical protein
MGNCVDFAPYVDVSLYPKPLLQDTPTELYSLGFVVADIMGEPSWGGYYPVASGYYDDQIELVRQEKKDVIVSFGGADGTELALVHSTCQLVQKYASVVMRYDLKYIDFDIEGLAVKDTVANKVRAEAIAELKKLFPKLHVSLTVATMPYGLDKDILDLVSQTPCDMVNIMAMNYGSEKDMFKATIKAANAVYKQTGKDIGITVMIGVNDTGEIFSLADARYLNRHVRRHLNWVKRLSFWSLNRDNGSKTSMEKSSMIDQSPYEFSKIFSNKC